MDKLKKEISRVVDGGRDVPFIFKQILKKKTTLLPDEEVEGLIFLEREHIQNKASSPVYAPAKLLVLTSCGLIIAEEGFIEIKENTMGYRVQHLLYNKIATIELDICMLAGSLRITTSSYGSPEQEIKFNTSRYFRDFEVFIDDLRRKVLKA